MPGAATDSERGALFFSKSCAREWRSLESLAVRDRGLRVLQSIGQCSKESSEGLIATPTCEISEPSHRLIDQLASCLRLRLLDPLTFKAPPLHLLDRGSGDREDLVRCIS